MKTTPASAALINGTAMHVDNFDDTGPQPTPDRNGGIHASAGVLAAALAIAEKTGADGAALSAAYHAGNEVALKLNHALDQRHYQGGFHVTITLGVFGAAAAAAKLLALDATGIGHALAFATARSAGVRANFGTMVEQMHTGLAAEGGVVAAELAAAGVKGADAVFEAPAGYFDAAAGGVIADAISGRLGKPWAIVDPGTSIKPWPNGALTHPAMTLVSRMMREDGLAADSVERIEVRTNERMVRTLIHNRPTNAMEARFSIPFALSALLVEGRAGIDAFTDEVVARTDIRTMMERIDYSAYQDAGADFTNLTTFVTVYTRDGGELSGRADFALGSARAPMGFDDVAEKARGCAAAGGWPADRTEALIGTVGRMERLGSTGELIATLTR